MRIRNGDGNISMAPEKTPPVRKTATRVTPTPTELFTKRGPAGKAKLAKKNETTPPRVIMSCGSKSEQSPEVKAPADAAMVTPVKNTVASGTRSGGKKKQVKTKTPASRKAVLTQTLKSQDAQKARAEESPNEEGKYAKKKELPVENVGEYPMQGWRTEEVEEPVVENVSEGTNEEETVPEDDEELVKDAQMTKKVDPTENVGDKEPSIKKQGPSPFVVEVAKFTKREPSFQKKGEVVNSLKQKGLVVMEVVKSNENKGASFQKIEEETDEDPEEEVENVEDEEKPIKEPIDKEANMQNELFGECAQPELDDYGSYDGYEEYGDQVDYGEHEEEEFPDEDTEEPIEETETLEDERGELNAIAKDRRIKKEHEIFVGGLDRDAATEDVRKVFERIGEIVEVRLHKNFSNNRNKGYAFVKFANKEHAKQALSEMKNPVICGKRCGTAPSEDNDTLFVGNICNTWTKEAIKQKLKDYGVEGIENINLVPDIQHEGLSRGFAFIEFSCHVDAMSAYKRLQKPDVVFGHPERTVKVAFAEPLREPDPEIMVHVKTVFLDGVPPQWNESQIREQIKGYGEIVRIVLARNLSTARRKDYGFVDFSTHEAAVACINGTNNKELSDGNSKVKIKARLSNPLPKTQAVKGGMSGGFRIGHSRSGTFSRFGRGFGRAGNQFNWTNFQRDRGFYNGHGRGQGQMRRMGPNEYGFDDRYTVFHETQFIGRGGRRGSFRGGHHAPGRAVVAAGPSRPNPTRFWHDGPDRGYGEHLSYRRLHFSQGSNIDKPFIERQVDDSYFYNDRARGVKRPFYAVNHDPDYTGPSRLRPRLDYNDPAIPFQGSRYRDNFGAHSALYSDEYYASDYGAYPPYPPYYGDDHSYGGGYYY